MIVRIPPGSIRSVPASNRLFLSIIPGRNSVADPSEGTRCHQTVQLRPQIKSIGYG